MTQWTPTLHAAGSRSKRLDIHMIPYSHRRRASESRTEAEYTDTTNRSSTMTRGGSDLSSDNNSWGLLSRIKLPGRRWNRRKPISEARFREKLIKRADKGDWGGVRKLISSFDFSDIPEPFLPTTKNQNINSSVQMLEEGHEPSHRRPSYGSRSGERLSFTGKESAAAAAAIKAALLEESSADSSEKTNIGENVLHDMCRYDPPLDVMETLLVSLRHRRGTTCGTDGSGRTPLHVAAAFGVDPKVIDALTRADPTPASMGDNDGRSPLHIAVRFLAYGATEDKALEGTEQARLPLRRNDVRHGGQSKVQGFARSVKTALLLKEVMVTHPGKIDFKDEDDSGFAPVDYAIDGEVTDDYLLHCLLTRKHSSRKRRSMTSVSSADTQRTSNLGQNLFRQVSGMSSISSDAQDIAVLHALEEDEIRDRRKRLEKMPRPKKQMKEVLFDVFGIDAHLECGPSDNHPSTEECPNTSDRGHLEKSSGATAPKSLRRSSEASSPSKLHVDAKDGCRSMTDSAIYNHHLQAYLNDFAGDDGLEFYDDDDDDFDIHHDPEEDIDAEGLDCSVWIGPGKPPIFEIDIVVDSMDDNLSQCSYGRSVVSEVTVPIIR